MNDSISDEIWISILLTKNKIEIHSSLIQKLPENLIKDIKSIVNQSFIYKKEDKNPALLCYGVIREGVFYINKCFNTEDINHCRNFNYSVMCIFEYRELDDLEILESNMLSIANINDELSLIEDVIKENPPKEYGLYKIIQHGNIKYTKDYWGEWDCDISPIKEKIVKFNEKEANFYLSKLAV